MKLGLQWLHLTIGGLGHDGTKLIIEEVWKIGEETVHRRTPFGVDCRDRFPV